MFVHQFRRKKTTTAERQRQHMIANLSTSFNVNSMCLPSGPRADLCHGSSECSWNEVHFQNCHFDIIVRYHIMMIYPYYPRISHGFPQVWAPSKACCRVLPKLLFGLSWDRQGPQWITNPGGRQCHPIILVPVETWHYNIHGKKSWL